MHQPAASPSLTRLAAAYRYLHYSDRIEGWMYQATALAMMELIWLQEEAGLAGNIAEIGVHHGCSALALVAAARPEETMIAIDLFDRQDLNADDSGRGSLAAFQEHLRYLFPRAKVRTVAKSSVEIRGAENEHGLAGLRFFSLDGGHTVALTLNDLEIAVASLAPHGIAVLDDAFNAGWPGVVSGLFAFLARGPDLVPFAIMPNKIFLSRRAFADRYRIGCREVLAFALHKKDMEFERHKVDVYEDRWPHLTPRLADPKVAATAEGDVRAIQDSGPPTAPDRASRRHGARRLPTALPAGSARAGAQARRDVREQGRPGEPRSEQAALLDVVADHRATALARLRAIRLSTLGKSQPPAPCRHPHGTLAPRDRCAPRQGAPMSILWTIIIGFVAGIIAKFLHPGSNEPSGFILTTLLGVAGAFVATYLGQALGWYQANEGAGLIGAVVGAIIVLVVWGLFAPRDRRI